MKQVVTKRGMALIAAAAVAVIGACSDSGKTDQGLTGPNSSASNGINGVAGDTSQTGGRHDSTAKKPVATFTLVAHVATPRPNTTDTLATDPVAGATVSITEETYTFIRGSGGNDTVHITNTVVATGTSDATGNVSFPNLKGASTYLIEAKPPVGSPLRLARIGIGQTFVDPLKLNLTLLHQ